ncbi:MAG: hypothetical protein CMH60_05985 [Myxococcales bacterium]|nr:hypothetical protein [Myxococcales bacterium]
MLKASAKGQPLARLPNKLFIVRNIQNLRENTVHGRLLAFWEENIFLFIFSHLRFSCHAPVRGQVSLTSQVLPSKMSIEVYNSTSAPSHQKAMHEKYFRI